MQSPSTAPLVIIDDSAPNEPEPAPRTTQLEFEELSYDLYKSWISRTPQTFTVYNEKRESIAKLPLHMFWYNKVEITHATKCTSKQEDMFLIHRIALPFSDCSHESSCTYSEARGVLSLATAFE